MASNSASSSKTDGHTLSVSQLKLDNIKKEHNLDKAVKSDDAEVPVHLSNEKVFLGPPTPAQSGTASFLRSRLIRHYQRRLLKDCRHISELCRVKLVMTRKAKHGAKDLTEM